MAKNYMKLELGDKERGLKFSMGTWEIIADHLGGDDPYEFFGRVRTPKEKTELMTLILYSGAVMNCMMKKEEPDFTYEDAQLWAKCMSMDEFKMVETFFVDAYVDRSAVEEQVEGGRTQATDVATSHGSGVRRAEPQPY